MKKNNSSPQIDPIIMLKALTDCTGSYAYVYDFTQNIFALSKGMSDDFGLQQQGVGLSEIWGHCIKEKDREALSENLFHAISSRQAKLQRECQVIDIHGSHRVLTEQITLYYNNETEKPQLLISSLIDCGSNDNVERFNTRLKAILDATPLCLNLWNRKFENTMCNQEAVKLFDLVDEREYVENFFSLSPPYQPDGAPSHEKAIAMISEAFNTGRVQFFWMHCNLNGEEIPAEITLVRIEYLDDDGGALVAGYTRDLRHQIAAEEEIKRFNNRMKAILDATPLCLNLWNTKFENSMCNKEAVKLFNLDDEREYIENFFSLSPPYQSDGIPSKEKAMIKIKEAFDTGRAQFLWTHCDLEGEEIPAEITLVRIDDFGDDEGTLVAGYTRDLRDQIAAEEKIKLFNTRLKAILDATPLCLNLWNKKFENTMCNHEAVNLFNLSNEREYVENFFALSPPYQPDGSPSKEKATLKIKEAFELGRAQFIWTHCNLQGEEIPAEITLVRIDDLGDEGEPLIAGFTRDIRAQIAAHHAQEQMSQRIHAVLDSMPLACFLWTLDEELLDCNQGAMTMLGTQDKQDILENFDSFNPIIQPDGTSSLQKKQEKFDEAVRNGHSMFEWAHLSKDGKEIPSEITFVKVALSEEDLIVAYCRDLRELYQTIELNDRLAKLAYHDLLTGCASRIRFMERLDESFRIDEACISSLVIFDIDFFKGINDNYGHAMGDLVLKKVVKCAEALLPKDCTLGRFGGDEFMIQCKNLNIIQLQKMLDKLVLDIGALCFRHAGTEFSITISVGASFKSIKDKSFQQLIERADKALYEAKNSGRNCSVIF